MEQSLTTQDNKIDKPKRVSGTGYNPETMEGKAALRVMKYSKLSADGINYEIDTDKIKDIIEGYIDEDRRTKTRTITYKNGTSVEEEYLLPISRVGLRRALDISRDTYSIWLHGYVKRSEIEEEGVTANINLSDAIRTGDDAIIQYLVESNGKYGTQKDIKLLETYGEIATKDNPTIINHGTMKLGIFEKWAK